MFIKFANLKSEKNQKNQCNDTFKKSTTRVNRKTT